MNIKLVTDVEITAPADRAWAVVADYSRDAEWRTGVLRMVPSQPGPPVVGVTTEEEIRVAGKQWRNAGVVTAVQPGERFEWRTTSGAVAHGARSVEPVGPERCRIGLELNVTPTGFNRFLAPVLRSMLRRNLRRDADQLRALIERTDLCAVGGKTRDCVAGSRG